LLKLEKSPPSKRWAILLAEVYLASADLIFELSETKGLIAFYENLDCSQNLSSYYRPQSNDIKRVQIDVIQQNLIVKTLIKKSEKLQDQLDEFNAVKKVIIDDEILEL